MKTKLTTTIAATAIAFSGMAATPAKSDELFNFIAGATAIYIIGTAIANSQNNQPQVTRNYPHYHPHPQPQPPRNHLVAPNQCKVNLHTPNGWRTFYKMRCTQNAVRNANRLPDRCIQRQWTANGWRNYYAAWCLHQNGWAA